MTTDIQDQSDQRKVDVEALIEELEQWQRAYPLDMFPEPDLERAAEILSDHGMTLDAISASNMRHVVDKIVPPVLAVLKDQRKSGWQPGETAPRDGTPVLAYSGGGEFPFIAHWGHVGRFTTSPKMWLGHPYGAIDDNDLIAWQPLSEPPEAA